MVTIIFTVMFACALVRFVASLTTQYAASSPKDDSHVKNVKIHPPLLNVMTTSYPITPLKGAPRLRAQCTLKRGRAHALLNRRKRLSISQKCET